MFYDIKFIKFVYKIKDNQRKEEQKGKRQWQRGE